MLSFVDVGRPFATDMPPVVSVFAPFVTPQPLLGTAALPLPPAPPAPPAPELPPIEAPPEPPPAALPPAALPPLFPLPAAPLPAAPPVAVPPLPVPPLPVPPLPVPPLAVPPLPVPPLPVPPLALPPVAAPPVDEPPVALPPVAVDPPVPPELEVPGVELPQPMIPSEDPRTSVSSHFVYMRSSRGNRGTQERSSCANCARGMDAGWKGENNDRHDGVIPVSTCWPAFVDKKTARARFLEATPSSVPIRKRRLNSTSRRPIGTPLRRARPPTGRKRAEVASWWRAPS